MIDDELAARLVVQSESLVGLGIGDVAITERFRDVVRCDADSEDDE